MRTGGQFRLPLVGGVIAPDQGLFPEYDAGLYTDGDTAMIVSRGLGNSIIPVRFCNRPEIVDRTDKLCGITGSLYKKTTKFCSDCEILMPFY